MSNFKAEPQVDYHIYQKWSGLSNVDYLNVRRIIEDIGEIKKSEPVKTLLNIGVGNNMLTTLLKNAKMKVMTMDILPELNPDILGSIHQITKLTENIFDVIVASHVLEHLPRELFSKILNQLAKRSRYCLIYLPISGINLSVDVQLKPFGGKKVEIFLPIKKFLVHKFDGQHYWEMETKGSDKKIIRELIGKYFWVVKEYQNPDWVYSYNYVLKSKITK